LKDAKRKLPKKQVVCSCGRHSEFLELGQDGKLICHFCKQKEIKFNRERLEQARNPNKKKIYFKCDVCKSQVSRSFYEVNNGLCDTCRSKKIGK
jgi:Zn finger protein HypA/HybF involved in hydrogenase expression